ncbi:hypothetical protein [Runella aurantiaca]|uniref:hypothetical protein n=1 Tax=Runella aurantiaca TaxID=2282308 RepID=UPI001314E6E7|nr:hypothetical protein [Runella aurantiaca]
MCYVVPTRPHNAHLVQFGNNEKPLLRYVEAVFSFCAILSYSEKFQKKWVK